jgi:WS/DGAT/MGAT family acyltransferase
MVTKLHHAAIDGVSSQAIAAALCDATPEIREVEGAEEWQADTPPTPFELTAMAIENNATRPWRYLEFLQKSVPAWTSAMEAAMNGALKPPPSVPRTRFNQVVSPHRVFEGVTLSLEKIKAIKTAVGGTVNDVVLAICAGALRNYLLEKDELPEQSLVSMCPVNVRDPNAATSAGNQVVSMSVPLHTDIADAKERLEAICTSTRDAKEYTNAIGARAMMEMAEFIPMELGVLGARVAAEQGIANFATPEFNRIQYGYHQCAGPARAVFQQRRQTYPWLGYRAMRRRQWFIPFCGQLLWRGQYRRDLLSGDDAGPVTLRGFASRVLC